LSFRRVFPYLATLVVLLVVFGIFVLRPTPFIGLTPEAMSDSFDRQLSRGTAGCEKVEDGQWSCKVTQTASSGAGPSRDYDVEINDFGCWTAEPTEERPALGTPSGLSGCVTLVDH
jgi:hypothetical protein